MKRSQSLLLHYRTDDLLTGMAKWSVSQVMSHPYRPGNLIIQSQTFANCGGNARHMQRMLNPCADMVVAWSIEDLSLMFQPSEWRTVHYCGSVPVICTTDIIFPKSLPLLKHFLVKLVLHHQSASFLFAQSYDIINS